MIDDSPGHYEEECTSRRPGDQDQPSQWSILRRGKNNRAIFLDRLANVNREQNKTDQAVQAYQKMTAMGGDYVERGYQGQVDSYRDAKQYDKAIQVAQQAAPRRCPRTRPSN